EAAHRVRALLGAAQLRLAVDALLDRRLMREVRVITVHPHELPVAVVVSLTNTGPYFDLTHGRRVEEDVDLLAYRFGQVLLEGHAGRAQAAEDETAVVRHARHLRQAELFLIQCAAVTVDVRHANEVAVRLVGPAVISAAEVSCVARLRLAHRV